MNTYTTGLKVKNMDNSEFLERFIPEDRSSGMFIHIQAVTRQKDHPAMHIRERARMHWLVRDCKEFHDLLPEMRGVADSTGSRIYMNITPKSMKALHAMLLADFAKQNMYGDIQNPDRTVNSAAGRLKPSHGDRRMLVDVDVKDMPYTLEVERTIRGLLKDGVTDEIVYVPTLHGVHLITGVFDRRKFAEIYPDIDIHMNSMGTLLYMNTEDGKN